MSTIVRPDLDRELSRLKNFQRDTVEYVFDRMYKTVPLARRFLVADEVGLGKTMVARGLVAKAIDHLWESVDRIDVIYICSNGSIARQNISRLNVSDAKDASLPSRITLLPTVVRGLKHRKLNFISLTPQTSFDLRSNLGTYEERALLYHLLPKGWTAGVSDIAIQNLLQGGAERDAFRRRVKEFDSQGIDSELQGEFHSHIANDAALQMEFAAACETFQVWRQKLPEADRALQRQIVGRLRLDLATSCLKALQPDLIILDEFQRFKHLLDGTDQASDLARKLFNFGDARVLLLSATPYKMYTIADEAGTDDHFRDFLQTVSFLHGDGAKIEIFKTHLDAYRNGLFALGTAAAETLDAAKDAVERSLRSVMVRTERLAASADRNGMLCELSPSLPLGGDDVATYMAYARIAVQLEQGDVTEYWKSAPYLFNFMDEYQFKTAFTDASSTAKLTPALRDVLECCPKSLLNWDDIERYRAVDPANARLRHMIDDVIGRDAWRLLWLPASLPYYEPTGPFADTAANGIGKRLIFSSWQVVPKVVAAALSYEAERRMFGERPDIERPNTAEERERLRPLLRFSRADGRLTGMPVLTLLYPSLTLAELGDPLEIVRSQGQQPLQTATQVLDVVTERLRPLLRELQPEAPLAGAADEGWYWAAPVLLDVARYPQQARDWLQQANLASVWRDEDGGEGDDEGSLSDAWADHVGEFVGAAAGQLRLGPQPDDLPEVLAKIALAGPGVVALRALSRICGGRERLSDRPLRNNAGWIAWSFRTLFNLPEVTAMIRRENSAEPYWQRVLEYEVAGGLQAVMDEFIHVAEEAEGVAHRPYREAARTVARRAAAALQLRTASLGVDAITLDNGGIQISDRRMRARFAARFGARQTDEGAGAVRADDVRAAFNSPFWPFVLCSTSVGQEGLDFHLYCHAVVHWNLPSNPVDLEQREGRVHRYKGHAIRKNAAMLYGQRALQSDAADPWRAAFEVAEQDRQDEFSDLVPYWILCAEGGARIERHVPALPLSKDIDRAEALRKTLTIYRMAFGQNRQDDIVAYLMSRFPLEEIEGVREQLKIDLAPPTALRNVGYVTEWLRDAGQESDHEDGSTRGAVESTITLAAAESLLDDFVRVHRASQREGIEHFRDLLDRFAALVK